MFEQFVSNEWAMPDRLLLSIRLHSAAGVLGWYLQSIARSVVICVVFAVPAGLVLCGIGTVSPDGYVYGELLLSRGVIDEYCSHLSSRCDVSCRFDSTDRLSKYNVPTQSGTVVVPAMSGRFVL
jgi:hypothetical protein